MKKTAIISAVALLALTHSGIAQQQDTPKTTITPGTEATQEMSKEVPTMKGGCPDTAQVDTKTPGTEATEAMSEEVPTMTAEADCPGKDQKKIN
jgi:hypothetical protein